MPGSPKLLIPPAPPMSDIKSDGSRVVSTSEMGDAIVAELAHQDAESLTDEEN